MQVYALMATHVVGLARIDEESGLGTHGNTSLEERVAVLREHRRVVEALDDLQFALEVLGLGQEGSSPGSPEETEHTEKPKCNSMTASTHIISVLPF